MSDYLAGISYKATNLLLFGILCIVIFIPTNYLVLTGILIYLWLIPLADVPVVVFQVFSIIVSSFFSIGLAWISTEMIRERSLWQFDDENISIAGHLLRLGLFLIAILDGALYFWNVIGMISALVLLWFGKQTRWRILGIVAWAWTFLVQIYVVLSFGV